MAPISRETTLPLRQQEQRKGGQKHERSQRKVGINIGQAFSGQQAHKRRMK
jgi:hypothetical protein